MIDMLPGWIADPLVTSAILGAGGFLLRGQIATFFVRAVDLKFEKSLEEAKASIRANERELETITTFLTSRQNERQSVIEAKKLEAAEGIMDAITALSGFAMFVEILKVMKLDEVAKSSDKMDLREFFKAFADGSDLDAKIGKFNDYDKTKARLYLSNRALSNFDNYTLIVTYAVLFVKAMSLGQDATIVLKKDALSSKIIRAVPASKEGFEKYGEGYAFHWCQYFYDQLVTSLRNEVAGSEQEVEDAATIVRLTASSIQAQSEARQITDASGLPQDYLLGDDDVPDNVP